MKRKYFIDNLRSLVILILFPFHTLRMFTSLDPFYVEGTPFYIADFFVRFMSTWFMNLLFVLAGMSTYYSIQKRSIKEYSKERLTRLLIPFITGVLLIVPAQTYFAIRQKCNYTGSYLHQYRLFAKITDLSGYHGGFTPGHLWFLLFLFIISFLSLPAIIYVKKSGLPALPNNIHFPNLMLILLFLPYAVFGLWEMGEPIGRNFFCFLLGFLFLSRDSILEAIKKNALKWFGSGFIMVILYTIYDLNLKQHFSCSDTFSYLFFYLASLLMIFGMIGFGQRYLDFQTKLTHLFSKNSFSIYYVHQSVLVGVGYYCLTYLNNRLLQILSIMTLSFLLSILLVWIIKKIPVLRTLMGMQK